jgi:hypothetical protein
MLARDLDFDPAGHGKDPRLVQMRLTLEIPSPRTCPTTELKIGDRVEVLRSAISRGLGIVTNIKGNKAVINWDLQNKPSEVPLKYCVKKSDRSVPMFWIGESVQVTQPYPKFGTVTRIKGDIVVVRYNADDLGEIQEFAHYSCYVRKLILLPLERLDKHTCDLFDVLGETFSMDAELHDLLAQLEQQRDLIRASGSVAQQGVWIEYGKVSKRKFRQAYYRSTTAIFPAKRQGSFANSESGLVKRSYLGEENSKEVKAAGDAIARRNELERIAKEIRLIEKKLEEE